MSLRPLGEGEGEAALYAALALSTIPAAPISWKPTNGNCGVALADDIRLELQNNADIINQLNTLSTLAVNVSSCVSFDRIQVAKNREELEMVAKELFLRNELFGSVIFNLPSSSNRQRRATPDSLSLPPLVNYTIRMSSRISQTTNRIRERIWTVGPHNSTSQSQIYSRAFIYIQDSIERAIIELQTGKSPEEIAVQVQATPYPCYNKDMFLSSVTYSLPFALMAAWSLFIAAFVKKLVQEKDLRLYEYMKMMGVNSSSHFIAWFIESATFLLITVMFLIIILKVGNILPKINVVILFLYLMDYSLSIIAMCYLISVFFNNTNIAALVGSLIYSLTFSPFIVLLVIENHLSFSVKSLLSLLSPTAFSYASQYIARYEEQGIDVKSALPPNLEPEPPNLTVGVSLHGITKTYGSKAAVENLSLNFYEENITSLLGHNGAGKTTTISILTGLFPASSGTIFVYGKDIRTDQDLIRKNMGVCMQHNVLFSYLTAKEHLLLYGYIKVPHWSEQELDEEVKRNFNETTDALVASMLSFPGTDNTCLNESNSYGGWSFGLPLTTDLKFDIRPVPANRTLTKVMNASCCNAAVKSVPSGQVPETSMAK
ncbi:ATP-binding cassette sub-family A member 12 [Chelonia mydas]|uniref:ATP-binding cassette sub-family A member 12 n=1 Tax=Chelonia mydas TaxID=8469 RepID=M7C948_CHEMY|nr:ATP-binding cassette sub-family A member 12 [Chelonia mydas]